VSGLSSLALGNEDCLLPWNLPLKGGAINFEVILVEAMQNMCFTMGHEIDMSGGKVCLDRREPYSDCRGVTDARGDLESDQESPL